MDVDSQARRDGVSETVGKHVNLSREIFPRFQINITSRTTLLGLYSAYCYRQLWISGYKIQPLGSLFQDKKYIVYWKNFSQRDAVSISICPKLMKSLWSYELIYSNIQISVLKLKSHKSRLKSVGRMHVRGYAACPLPSDRPENEISKIRYLNKAGGTQPAMARAIL